MKSEHQLNVEAFMLRAKQEVPIVPTPLPAYVRILRAKLIFEEAMETITKGLGVKVIGTHFSDGSLEALAFKLDGDFDMVETIDGVCDLSVVGVGTLSAMGVPDLPFIRAVDANNLEKFAPGYSWRIDGKLQKPPGHKPPDLRRILENLTP